MSVSDELMWRYYAMLTTLTVSEVEELKARVSRGDLHPKQAKVDLAKRIVSDLHDPAAAEAAAEAFERRFVRKEAATDLPIVPLVGRAEDKALKRVLVRLGFAQSVGDATRKIQQRGVRIAGQTVADPNWVLPDGEHVVHVGKLHVARVNSRTLPDSPRIPTRLRSGGQPFRSSPSVQCC